MTPDNDMQLARRPASNLDMEETGAMQANRLITDFQSGLLRRNATASIASFFVCALCLCHFAVQTQINL